VVLCLLCLYTHVYNAIIACAFSGGWLNNNSSVNGLSEWLKWTAWTAWILLVAYVHTQHGTVQHKVWRQHTVRHLQYRKLCDIQKPSPKVWVRWGQQPYHSMYFLVQLNTGKILNNGRIGVCSSRHVLVKPVHPFLYPPSSYLSLGNLFNLILRNILTILLGKRIHTAFGGNILGNLCPRPYCLYPQPWDHPEAQPMPSSLVT